MKSRTVCVFGLLFSAVSANAGAVDVNLGAAEAFAVLAGSTVTSTGPTTVYGDLGVWPGTSITGFPAGVVVGGAIHDSDIVAMQAQAALTTAYNVAAASPCGMMLTGQNLGGLTLTPGVYCLSSSAQLTGTLTLNAQGDANANFLFLIGSTLTTASASSVVFENGVDGDHVFWQVGSSATLGTTTSFEGNILAADSITLDTGANIGCGRALAETGAVTMDSNNVSIANSSSCEASSVATPEPTSGLLLSGGLLSGWLIYRRKRVSGSV